MGSNIVHFHPRSTCRPTAVIAKLGDWSVQWTAPGQRLKGHIMAKNSIQSEADAIATEFANGDLQNLSLRYEFPVVVHVRNKIIVLKTEEQFLIALSLYRSLLLKEGLSQITSTVTEKRRQSDLPSKVCVKNRYFAANGRDLGTAKINYYSEGKGADRKIRMVEYLEWPCPHRIAECTPLQCMMV